MTTKAEFNADEWETIVTAPVLAALRVATAARGGTIRESLAVGRAYSEARQQQGESELLDEIVASPPTLDARSVGSQDELARVSSDRLGEAVGLLEPKASPEELEAYKGFVISVARTAAEAHREGGVLGIGGEKVSEAEQRALDEIAGALQQGR